MKDSIDHQNLSRAIKRSQFYHQDIVKHSNYV